MFCAVLTIKMGRGNAWNSDAKRFICGGTKQCRAGLRQTAQESGNGNHEPIRKPASLKMVAESVGLSTAAVFRVLNGPPAAKSIPKATQERILTAARQLTGIPFFGPDSQKLYRSSAVWQGQSCNSGRKTERFRAALDSTA
jgi:hypothetical protein